jgi:suppressor of ftsI
MRRHVMAFIATALVVAGCSTQGGDDDGAGTTSAAPTTAPRDEGQPFAQPEELRSANGVLRVTLTAEEREVTIAGVRVRGRVFNGSFVAPTLRVRPGDRLEVTLVNKLAQMTNLHTHGFHVTPQADSDNVFRMVQPGSDRLLRLRAVPELLAGHLLVSPAHARGGGVADLRRHVRGDHR